MFLLSALSLLLVHSATASSPSHSYSFEPSQRPPRSPGAFTVLEGIVNLDQCTSACDSYSKSSNGPCAGFTLLNVTGAYLCAHYHTGAGVFTPDPPEAGLVGFYRQGAPCPAPAPSPPLPPPHPKPQPIPPAPRAPDHYTATLHTDVGANASIVFDVVRSNAPNGADQFHRLCSSVGFFNEAAFFRYVPDYIVEWGVSSNATLNAAYGHTPIPSDPVVLSNVEGTVSFADNGMGRATVVFINFGNNSKLDATNIVPFANVDPASMKTAKAIFNPTPNSSAGVPAQAYADNGNAWIRKEYAGINFITGCTVEDSY